ncbi:helix-turn-helix transcriptional regulator [Micromonospora rhizosphaerae]|nr:helix-turn-helix transcriptional regulator [Micromonospora rhizosphaerae]
MQTEQPYEGSSRSDGRSRQRPGVVPSAVKSARTPDDYLETLRPLLEPMSKALGNRCEIVLHDFRQPEHSIVAITGDVTGRSPGGSVTQIGLAIIRAGDDAEDQYNYITKAPNGRILKSTTAPLRDADGHVFGALCVNVDVTEMWMMSQTIQEMIDVDAQTPQPVTFVDDIDRVIGEVLQEETKMLGRPLTGLTRAERLQLLKALDYRGVFSLQRSVPQVAEHLGLSRATLYNDLREMRRDNDD